MNFIKETKFKEISELGIKVPEDWEVARVDDNRISLKIKSGTTPSKRKEEYWNGNILFVTIGDMTKTCKYLMDTENKITELALRESRTFLVPEENILLSMYGTIGKVVINKKPVAISQNIAGIIVNKQHTDVQYLFYALQHYSYQFERAKIITLRHLDIKMVKNSLIPLPPLEEQKAIAEILSTIDKAVEKTQEAIKKAEKLKKCLMQKLLTGEIRIKEENGKWIFYKETEFQDTEIGKIPKEWGVVKLGNIVEIYDHKRIPLKEQERKKRPGPYPYCGATGIIDYIDGYIFDGKYLLLVEDGGPFGKFEKKAYIMEGRFWANNHVHVLKVIENEAITEFLLNLLNMIDLHNYITGSTRKKLRKSDMVNIKILLPPLKEQKRIAEVLMTVDKKIELLKKKKELLEKVKRWFMQKLLTGEIRVKVK